ncbi:MAG: type II secretion system F family protein [Candidatus Eremiobacteraeota bacterium]|nr:type II secretion system F family protein [Candidatus Eremiobacteraeota bacterium]
MSEHDSGLPDPRKLFEQMEREARESERPSEPDSGELPDPEELFREMERYRNQGGNDEVVLEATELTSDAVLETDSELPDPEELFEQMRRMAGAAREDGGDDSEELVEVYEEEAAPFIPLPGEVVSSGEGLESWGVLDEDEPLPHIPMPNERAPAPDENPWKGLDEEDLTPFIPLPGEGTGQSAEFPSLWDDEEDGFDAFPADELESWGQEDDSLPYIPAPDEAPVIPQPPPEETSSSTGGFLNRLKSKFKKTPPEEETTLDYLGGAREPEEPARLPTPEELFRQMKAEREEAALNFESDAVLSGESMLPTPEELFRRMEEEYAEQEGAELPALPDLEALKAELEAEERARLDPDVESDLAGPERFVETVSDNIFAFEQPSFSPDLPGDPFESPEEAFEQPPKAKLLPRPMTPPVPPPLPDQPAAAKPPPVNPPVKEPARPASPYPKPAPLPKPEPPPEFDPEEASPTGTVQVGVGTSPDPDTNRAPTAGQRTRSMSYAKQRAEEKAKAEGKKKFKRFSRQKLAIFTRQMSVMLKSGIQLHMAVQFAADSDPELHETLTEVMRKVESGYTFSAALGETSRTFDQIYVGLVQSGEMSGRLYEILARLADALEREVELRKRIVSIVTYPLVLLLVCFAGTLGFIFFVLPTLTPLFKELSVDLPLPTKILLSSREWLLPGTFVVTALAFLFYLTRDRISDYIRSKPMLERRLATIPFHLPIFGQVYEKLITARVLYSLSTMLDVGITLNQALARTEATAGNALVAFRLSKARLDLADGMGVTDCFRFNQLFTPSALYLISAGEESARLAEMFAFVARIFDEDVEYSLQSAASILEPLIMVVMGMVVGFITIAAALPTIHLLQNFT